MKNWRIELTVKKLSSEENPERYILRRCTITRTICENDDATQSQTKEINMGDTDLQKHKKKINYRMYMDNIKMFAKSEKELETPYTGSEHIQLRYKERIWHRKMCLANYETQKIINGRNRTAKLRKN